MDAISFSKNICQKLGYPKYVQILIHDEKRQILVRPCGADDPEAFKFTSNDERQYVAWHRKSLSRRICNHILEFDPRGGDRAYIDGEYYDGDNAFLFNTRNFYTKQEKDFMPGLD